MILRLVTKRELQWGQYSKEMMVRSLQCMYESTDTINYHDDE